MQEETLKFISDELESAGIPYEFMEFKTSIEKLDCYFVGEYQEIVPVNENGEEESQFILTGTSRNKKDKGGTLILEDIKQKIKKIFPSISGNMATLENGSCVAVFYENAFPVRTGDAFLKRIQINLKVKEWSVN